MKETKRRKKQKDRKRTENKNIIGRFQVKRREYRSQRIFTAFLLLIFNLDSAV